VATLIKKYPLKWLSTVLCVWRGNGLCQVVTNLHMDSSSRTDLTRSFVKSSSDISFKVIMNYRNYSSRYALSFKFVPGFSLQVNLSSCAIRCFIRNISLTIH